MGAVHVYRFVALGALAADRRSRIRARSLVELFHAGGVVNQGASVALVLLAADLDVETGHTRVRELK